MVPTPTHILTIAPILPQEDNQAPTHIPTPAPIPAPAPEHIPTPTPIPTLKQIPSPVLIQTHTPIPKPKPKPVSKHTPFIPSKMIGQVNYAHALDFTHTPLIDRMRNRIISVHRTKQTLEMQIELWCY